MTNLIVREFNGKKIRHREDGFMSLTDMCQAQGKRLNDWYRLDSTKEYLKVLTEKYYADSRISPIEVSVGNRGEIGGTWGDRHVAIRLAQWLSPEFALQVDEWILELLNKGSVSIKSEQPAIGASLGIADLNTIYGIMQGLGLTEDPILKSGMTQRLAEHMGTTARLASGGPAVGILTVRAAELGVSQRAIGTGSALGKWIITLGFPPLGKTQHGRYPVNTFHLTPELDQAILRYFGK